MTEAEIRRAAPSELADLPEDFWDDGELVAPTSKQAISLRVDEDVLEWFKQSGPRYQTRINAVLRSYMARMRMRKRGATLGDATPTVQSGVSRSSQPTVGGSSINVTVSDYPDVYARALDLGLKAPGSLSILPRGFSTAAAMGELCHESDVATLRKVSQEAGVVIDQVQPPDAKLPSVVQRSADWVAPTIFVGGMLLSQNPVALQLAVEVIGSYVVDVVKGRAKATAKLTFVVEQKGGKTFKKCEYEGPVDGLAQLPEVLRSVHDGKH